MIPALVLVSLLAQAPAGPEPAPPSRAAAVSLAALAGLAVPGVGHWYLGDRPAAHRLVLLAGSGVAAAAAGGLAIALSGGSQQPMPVAVPLLFSGATLWAGSWLADVAGTASGDGFAPAFSRESGARVSLQYGGGRDPATPVRHLGTARAAWEATGWMIDGWGSLAPGERYHELHARAGPKLWSDGVASHLALLVEGMREASAASDATAHGGAALLELRFDAGRLSESLRGLVFLQRAGLGALVVGWDGSPATDTQELLVLDAGLSAALSDRVEVGFLYSQRPDHRIGWFADHGGLFQLESRVRVAPNWRLLLSAELGAGFDAQAGLEAAW